MMAKSEVKYLDTMNTPVKYDKEWTINACCFLTQQEIEEQDSYNLLLLLDSAANISAVCNPNLIPKVQELEKKFVITHSDPWWYAPYIRSNVIKI